MNQYSDCVRALEGPRGAKGEVNINKRHVGHLWPMSTICYLKSG